MAKYLREAGSLFPEKILQPMGYLDVTDEIAETIKQIKSLQSDGKYSDVQELLIKNPSLEKHSYGSKSFNRTDEEVHNLQIYAKNVQQQIFYQEDNPIDAMSNQDVWIGGALL